MKEFSAIRKAALAKRDAAIKRARDQYTATIERIAELEQDIVGVVPRNHRSIADCVNSMIPSDRTFTVADLMAGLKALDPSRDWRKRSVYCRLRVLKLKGAVKCVKLANGKDLAVYALADLPQAADGLGVRAR